MKERNRPPMIIHQIEKNVIVNETIVIDTIDVIESIGIDNTVTVILIIITDLHVNTRVTATTIEPRTTTETSSLKKKFTHISNAKRKIRISQVKTECSGMDFSGSRKHKGNTILSNLILFCRKTRKASRKRRRE